MKKFLSCLIVMLLLGGIFGIAMQSLNIKEDAPVIGAVIDVLSPSVAYAGGGDGGSDNGGPAAPPPRD